MFMRPKPRPARVKHGLITIFLSSLVAACGVPTPPTASLDPLHGQYSATGGGGAVPAVQALAARFKELHPGVVWTVTETGSDAAISLAASGNVDLGFISRDLKESEKTKVGALSIGFSGTAVIVNAANPVTNLTRDQVRRIYVGEITNWSQVGGIDEPIRPFIREANAATRTSFEAYIFGTAKPTYAKAVAEVFEVEATFSAVASFRGSIGIATVGARTAQDTALRMIAIDGIFPTLENLADGSYKIERPLYLVYPAGGTAIKPAVQGFLDFAKSPEGQKVAASAS